MIDWTKPETASPSIYAQPNPGSDAALALGCTCAVQGQRREGKK